MLVSCGLSCMNPYPSWWKAARQTTPCFAGWVLKASHLIICLLYTKPSQKPFCCTLTWKKTVCKGPGSRDADHPTVDPVQKEPGEDKLGDSYEAPSSGPCLRLLLNEAALGTEWGGNQRIINSLKVTEKPGKAAAQPAQKGLLSSGHEEWKQTGC